MARKPKQKLLATITPDYQPDFVERLDRRCRLAEVIPARIGAIESDMGGPEGLGYKRRSLVKRAVWLEAVVETYEQHLAENVVIDLGAYTQAINSLLGLYRMLGLERQQRRIPSLAELLDDGEESASQVSPNSIPESGANGSLAASGTTGAP